MSQKEISFPVTLCCKPVDFYSVSHLREIANDLYPEISGSVETKDYHKLKVVNEFLNKLEEL